MQRRLLHLLITALCSVLLVSVCATGADARQRGKKVPRVSGITRVGQDWYHAKLQVKWRAVPGSSYQMRWSYTPSKLSYSKVVSTGTAGGTYTSALDRSKTWYVQVRAIRSGKVGAWSRARGLRFLNAWPRVPSLSASSLPGAVKFSWPYTPYASRYRVRWSAAWYGQWPGSANYVNRTSGGWVSQYDRSTVYNVPARPGDGDNFLAPDYANPVFGQIEANNAYNANASASLRSKWVMGFPTPPAPPAGDPVRMGNYNAMLFPTGSRAAAIASNISSHGVTLVALQEANKATANAVVSSLGSNWRAVPSGLVSGMEQQILYRVDKFNYVSSGSYTVWNPRNPSDPSSTPWARFSTKNSSRPADSQSFFVSSVHFSEDSSKSRLERNADTGRSARDAMSALNKVNYGNEPVIVAGDLRYTREPYGDFAGYTPAQPTFVRAGYYDTMAALKRSGSQYSIVNSVNGNPTASQVPHPSGLGPRSDHILVKGFRGSSSYANVVNWKSASGSVPSDHNLIYSDIAIPFRQ
jgi:hypothetical protein